MTAQAALSGVATLRRVPVSSLDAALEQRARLRAAPLLRRLTRRGAAIGAVHAVRRLTGGGRGVRARAKTFWGGEMHVRLPEALSSEVFSYGFFEEGLSAFLLSEVKAGDVVYDVGAHYGYFSLLASYLVGPTGQVHSFEPTPETFQMLSSNCEGATNVRLNREAVWSEPAELTFNDFGQSLSMYNSLFKPRLPPDAAATATRQRTVAALPLDQYASRATPPTFVKIDAESAEEQVLDGMEGLLRGRRPKLTLEVGDAGIDGVTASRTLIDRVLDHGYEAYEYSRGQVRPHRLLERYEYDNILFLPS